MTHHTYTTYARHTIQYLKGMLTAAIVLVSGTMLQECSHDNPWDEVPQNITVFVSQYYPDSSLESYSYTDGTYRLDIKNGPEFTFDKSGKWTSVNGYGMPIVQVFLFDQLPPKLFSYLDETQQTDDVFAASRKEGIYTLKLLNSSLKYDSATDEITGSDASGGNVQKP